jgi:uncharacterized protein with von Willebrand factor type A (vWA) domain
MVAFACTVRAAGVEAGPDRVQAMVTALDHLDVRRRADVFWAGRLTLCGAPEDLPRYDRAFAAFFAGERAGPGRRAPVVEVPRAVTRPGADPADAARDGDPGRGAATANAAEILRHRDLAHLGAVERAEVHRLIALLHPVGATRRSRRQHSAHRGALDVARTVRTSLRHGGEPVRLHRRRPRPRPRRLVLLIDVSGSMQPYAEAMLRFAHAAARGRTGTEVFTIGTRLTRVSRELRGPEPAAALRAVGATVPDWSGGTRLGELVKAFLDRWGQRGTARGAVVVIASDGWERGDPALLGAQMRRLHRLAHRVVWVNPHKAKPGYAPLAAGMAAALPSVDDFVEGHSVAALEDLAAVLAGSRAEGTARAR